MRAPLVLAVAALAASLAAAQPGRSLPPPPKFGAADPALVGKTADYAHFSELIATVMLVREGGVEQAMEAVPALHDETDAYIKTISLLAASKDGNASEWKGLSAKALAKLGGKNLTENDPVKQWGDAVEAKLNATGKLDWDPSADPKLNKTTAALNAFADKLGANDAEMIDQLNAKLSKYNIEVTGKSVAQPSKFANEAAAIARSITGISLGLTGVEFNPCLISYGVTGVSLGGTGINVAPVGLQTSAVGSLVSVQGANIQPSLILVQPIGANVQPQGFQVAPFLIAVSPLGANVQPQGLNVAPVNVAVTPTGASFAPVGKATAPVDIAYAPVDIDLTPDDGHDHDHKDGEDGHAHADGDGHDHDHADGDGHAHADAPSPSSSSRRRLTAVKAGSTPWLTPGKVSVMPDPLDLSNEFPHDYRNWASVLSQVLLKKEGDADVASAALARIMLDAHGHLAKAAGGDPFLPRFHLTDPSLLSSMVGDGGKAAGLPPVEATKFASGANFIDFKPCVLSESYTGVDAGLIGLSFDPALVSISAALSQNEFVGINFNPNIIFLSAIGAQVNPQGLNVQPALLYVGPIGTNVQPQGGNIQPTLINVAPLGAGVQPVGRLIAPAHKVFAPTHKAYAPVKEDTVEEAGIENPRIDLAEEAKEAAGMPTDKKKP